MTAREAAFFKKKMKKIKEAKKSGDDAVAQRHARELRQYFNL